MRLPNEILKRIKQVDYLALMMFVIFILCFVHVFCWFSCKPDSRSLQSKHFFTSFKEKNQKIEASKWLLNHLPSKIQIIYIYITCYTNSLKRFIQPSTTTNGSWSDAAWRLGPPAAAVETSAATRSPTIVPWPLVAPRPWENQWIGGRNWKTPMVSSGKSMVSCRCSLKTNPLIENSKMFLFLMLKVCSLRLSIVLACFWWHFSYCQASCAAFAWASGRERWDRTSL